jgi:hypothetical protein
MGYVYTYIYRYYGVCIYIYIYIYYIILYHSIQYLHDKCFLPLWHLAAACLHLTVQWFLGLSINLRRLVGELSFTPSSTWLPSSQPGMPIFATCHGCKMYPQWSQQGHLAQSSHDIPQLIMTLHAVDTCQNHHPSGCFEHLWTMFYSKESLLLTTSKNLCENSQVNEVQLTQLWVLPNLQTHPVANLWLWTLNRAALEVRPEGEAWIND